MKRLIPLVLLVLIACNHSTTTPEEMQEKLKSSMIQYLYAANAGNDSIKVKYTIMGDVYYYDDELNNCYDCQFKVRMSLAGKKDTTGTMGAYISKDFKVLKRFQ
jgi:hypothetical protein